MRANGLRMIALGMIILLAIAGCGKSTEPKNQNPSVPTINPAGFTILPGGTVALMAAATDPEGDPITYTWTFDQGTPLTATGAIATWTAPATESNVEATVVVTDGRGGRSSATTQVTVHPNAAYPYATPFSGTLETDVTQLGESALAEAPRGICHAWASVVVTWTGSAVFIFTGVPSAAFVAALTHEPVWVPPATWIWAYTVPWGTSTAMIELYATLSGATHLDWEMYVSGTIQQYNRFQWVTGRSRTDAIEGYWQLYDFRTPTAETPALRIGYARRAADDRDLSYRVVLTTSTAYGDSLVCTARGTENTGRLYDVSAGTSIRVVWDTLDGHGRYVAAGGDSCCWGPAPAYADLTTCP